MPLADLWHSDVLRNSIDTMRYDAELRSEILAMLDQLGRELVADLAESGLDTPRTDWQRARLQELLKSTHNTISDTYTGIMEHHAAGMAGAAEASTTGLLAALNGSAGVELLSAIKWTPELLKALVDGSLIVGAPSEAWWARQSVDLQQAFSDQMQQGMLRGETLSDLTGRVKDLVGISKNNAEKLVRTSAMAVNNSAHKAFYEANSDVIADMQWVSTFDNRVCIECLERNLQHWPLDAPHEIPPLHWNCRCCVVALTKSWEELATQNKELAAELDKMEPGLRSSMGGPISSDTTWESWLGSLSKEDQSAILGPTRQKLWDAGKLKLSELTDQRGNSLTLAQLGAR